MSIRVKVCMSKIMCTPIKVGVCPYVTYPNCQTLDDLNILLEETERLCLIIVIIRAEGKANH